MKYNFLIAFSLLFLFTNCGNDDNIQDVESIIISWHLIESKKDVPVVVKHEFTLDNVIWIFDNIKKTLTVYNKNTDDSKRDLLDSGTYTFSTTVINGEKYIFIDTLEYGLLTINNETNQLTINENKKTTGEVNNRFVYTFQNVITINE